MNDHVARRGHVTRLSPTALAAIFCSLLVAGPVTAAPPTAKLKLPDACAPRATNRDDTIVCDASGFKTIAGRKGNDTILVGVDTMQTITGINDRSVTGVDGEEGNDTVEIGGRVAVINASLGPGKLAGKEAGLLEAIGIAGGEGDDVIQTPGTVTSTAIASTAGLGNLHTATTVRAAATGISGDDGDDTVVHSGSLSATAIASVVQLGDGGEGAAPNNDHKDSSRAAEATAVGISGGDGDDVLRNDGEVSVTAFSLTEGLSVDLSVDGNAEANSSSHAVSNVTGMGGNGGDDEIVNNGTLATSATATAFGQNASIGGNRNGSGPGQARDDKNSWIGDPVATATGTAIDGGDGDDTITNDGIVSSASTAVAGDLGVSINAGDVRYNSATSKATAGASGFVGGAGNDTITNRGQTTVDATAVAVGVSAAVGFEADAKIASQNGTLAEASATGISGDQYEPAESATRSLTITPHELRFETSSSETVASGDDTIANEASLVVRSRAVSGEAAGAVGINASGAANVNSTATAEATGIDAGSGNDHVDNAGELLVRATAVAAGISTAASSREETAGDEPDLASFFEDEDESNAEGRVEAKATATGVSTDGGTRSVLESTSLRLSADGLALSRYSEDVSAQGNDTLDNSERISAVATATSGSLTTVVGIQDKAAADVTTVANAVSTGASTGGGDDTITNSGTIGAVSTAVGIGAELSIGVKGDAKLAAEAGIEADATASGIDTDGDAVNTISSRDLEITPSGLQWSRYDEASGNAGADSVTNTGEVTAVATAVAGQAAAAVSIEGSASGNAGTSATSRASGITTGAGDDFIANTNTITSFATSTAVALQASLSVSGTDEDSGNGGSPPPGTGEEEDGSGASSASTSVTAAASATGISADEAEHGTSTAFDLSIGADGLGVSYLKTSGAVGGSDTIANTGNVNAVATAVAASEGIAVTVEGDASSDTSSTASSFALGIDAGTQDDHVFNGGNVNAVATAIAAGMEAAITTEGDAGTTNEAGSTATASATGIAGDGAARHVLDSTSLDIDRDGLEFTRRSENLAASGDDTIEGAGDVIAVATAASGELSGAVSMEGAAKADATSTATATAVGIDAGNGDDVVNSRGRTVAVATALAAAIETEVALAGGDASVGTEPSAFESDSLSSASATGIKGDGDTDSDISTASLVIDTDPARLAAEYTRETRGASGDDVIDNEGAVAVGAIAHMASADVAYSAEGYAIATTTAAADAAAVGIDAGGGNDSLSNAGTIDAGAEANAVALNASIAPKSNAVAADAIWAGGSSATASATGVDADGANIDALERFALSIAATGGFVSYTTSESHAAGDDEVLNFSRISASALSLSNSAALSYSKQGVAASLAQSNSFAEAVGITTGGGNDTIRSSGQILVTGVAEAASLAGSFTKSDAAVGGNAFWDGGVTAVASARGIDAAGDGSSVFSETRLDVGRLVVPGDDGVSESRQFVATLSQTEQETAAAGDNTVNNGGAISATALATTTAISAELVTSSGVAVALSSATAEASADGITSGGGSDELVNRGIVLVQSTANANAINGTYAKSGAAIAASPIADSTTTATSTATGIDADGDGIDYLREHSVSVARRVDVAADGSESVENAARLSDFEQTSSAAGDDSIRNSGLVTATATALGPSGEAAITKTGVSAALTAISTAADAVGIDAGAGHDEVRNTGALAATAFSVTPSIAASVNQSGAAAALNPFWDGGVQASANAAGIDADGRGGVDTDSSSLEVIGRSVEVQRSSHSTAAAGDDVVVNSGAIVASSLAEVLSGTGGGTSSGASLAIGTAAANAAARGIITGGGADEVRNTGAIVSSAVANANSLNVAFSKTGGTLAADSIFRGGTTARADAAGIAADGEVTEFESTQHIRLSDAGLVLETGHSESVASGDDRVGNDGEIVTTAIASAPSLAAGITFTGVAGAATSATSEATARGIVGGGGNDVLANRGVLSSQAVANADSVSVSVTPTVGGAVAANDVRDGGATALANATGIDGDDDSAELEISTRFESTLDGVSLEHRQSVRAASGDDRIVNDGVILSVAESLTPSLNVSVAPTGAAASIGTATAESFAAGIRAGAGDDTVVNRGNVVSLGAAEAVALNVSVVPTGVALASDAIFNGGTTATADSVGIDGDSEAVDDVTFIGAAVNDELIELVASRSLTGATGEDRIANSGRVDAIAIAASGSAGVAAAPAGLAVATTASNANARSAAIDAGGGDDVVHNAGTLTSSAIATAATASVAFNASGGVAASGNNLWDGGATSNAEAVGISGDGRGEDFLLDFRARSDADGLALSFDAARLASSGDDRIVNTGDVSATAVSVAPGLGVAVTPAGLAVAAARTTANARAAAVDAGAGNDLVRNEGTLNATASATAVAAQVSFSAAGVALSSDAIFDGGTTADAEAIGIDTDGTGIDTTFSAFMSSDGDSASAGARFETGATSGDDVVDNDGEIGATAVAVAPSIAVSVVPAGVSGAITTSTAEARSAAIDTGAGDDRIRNAGDIRSTAIANADTVSVSVVPAGLAVAANALWNGGATARADAVGIDADGRGTGASLETQLEQDGDTVSFSLDAHRTVAGGDDVIRNFGDVNVDATAVTPSVGVAVTPAGVSVAATTATAEASAAAIKAGPGDDRVYNEGELRSTANAIATAINVAVAPGGGAVAGNDVWDGGTVARSRAVGIETDGMAERHVSVRMTNNGIENFTSLEDFIEFNDDIVESSGVDRIINDGDIIVHANSVAPSITVSVAVYGAAASISTATAEAEATGITSGAGEDYIENHGDIDTTSVAVSSATNVSVAVGGVAATSDAVWDGGTTARTWSTAIDSGADADRIINEGDLSVVSTAVAPAVTVPVGVFGVAASSTTATAEADAVGIAAGDGNDDIDNHGEIRVASRSNATAVSVPVNVFGVAASFNDFWDGGVESNSTATGIAGGAGDDHIDNHAYVEAFGNAVTPSVTVAFTVGGVTGAVATSTATTAVDGIAGGSGNDTLNNLARISAEARATAVTVGTAISVFGVAGALDSVWNGGTTGMASAASIRGGDGDDRIDNFSIADSYALARANSDQIAATLIGVAAALATSSSSAESIALDGGDGDDHVTNRAQANSTSDARATSVGVAAAGIGITASVDDVWDGGTNATSTSTGIGGGAGEDTLHNLGDVTSTALADTASVSVAASVIVGAASYSTSTAEAASYGIAGDEGDDAIVNAGVIDARADADAGATSVAATMLGAVGSGSFADERTSATADALGMSGGAGDDVIVATGVSDIDVLALAATRDRDVAVVPTAGFADGDADSTAIANAWAAEGGTGADIIELNGEVDVTATANAFSSAFSWASTGFSRADAGSIATSTAFGASGDAGDDVLLNLASLTGNANATAVGKTIELSVAGYSGGSAETEATAFAYGMNGGGGNDVLVNAESLGTNAFSSAEARGFTLSLIGGAVADTTSTASAHAFGLFDGTGDNRLWNTSSVSAHAESLAVADGVSLSVIGGAGSNDGLFSNAHAHGMATGDGADLTINGLDASLDVSGLATTELDSLSLTVIGGAGQNPLSATSLRAYGIDSGDGSDTVLNLGNIAVHGDTSQLSSGDSTVVFSFHSAVDSTLQGDLRVFGIDSGEGNDDIVNEGLIDVSGLATMSSVSSSWAITGVSSVDGGMETSGDAYGIRASAGDDRIYNSGTVIADLDFTGTIESSSVTVAAGATGNEASFSSEQFAAALSGGDGADLIENSGTLFATTYGDLAVTGSSTGYFLALADGVASLSTRSQSVGIDGGQGIDTLLNFGNATVGATSHMSAASTAFSISGESGVDASVDATAIATGMDGGAGDDLLANPGSLQVLSESGVSSSGSTQSVFGDDASSTDTTSTAAGTGMSGGAGDDVLYNLGELSVVTRADPTAASDSDALRLLLGSDAQALAAAAAEAVSVGLSAAGGDNVLLNDGDVTVSAAGTGLARGVSESTGSTTSSASSTAVASGLTVTAQGIAAGDGDNQVRNAGVLDVGALQLMRSVTDGYSVAAQSDTGSRSDTGLDAVSAIGIDLGDGANAIGNTGDIDVVASPEARSESVAVASGITLGVLTSGSLALAESAASADDALAVGIRAGDGINRIWNEGTVAATSAPVAVADADASPAIDALIVNAEGQAESSASNARAYGILAGDGDNAIHNSGTISALANPLARAFSDATGFGFDGDATAIASAGADGALAAGIRTGNGNNVIINEGSIVAAATPTATASAAADAGQGAIASGVTTVTTRVCRYEPRFVLFQRILRLVCETVETVIETVDITEGEEIADPSTSTENAVAYGILTGAGNDLIVNSGSIDASVTVGGDTSLGWAIWSGAGRDQLRLGDGSTTLGHVHLGDDDDIFALWGTPLVSGNTNGGNGVDSIVLNGSGSFAGTLLNFEHLYKQHAGTFALHSLPVTPFSLIEVDGGTLLLDGNYSMPGSSTFGTFVSADGSHGRFEVTGTLGLGGTLSVENDAGLYVDGTRYGIIGASDIAGTFSVLDLPDATPVLSFAVDYGSEQVEVVASVASLAEFADAGNGMASSMGDYLDSLTETASGDLASVLMTLQHTDDVDLIADTLSDLAPSDQQDTIDAQLSAVQHSQDAVQARLAAVRNGVVGGGTALAAHAAVNLISGDPAGADVPGGAWAATYSYDSGHSISTSGQGNFASQNFVIGGGFDMPLGDRGLLGASVFRSYTDLSHARADDFTEIGTTLASFYGSYRFDDGYYAQGMVSAGPSENVAFRYIDSDFFQSLVQSRTDGDILAGNVEFGRQIQRQDSWTEFFGGLSYTAMHGNGFAEEGAGAFGFISDRASIESMVSELGFRSARSIRTEWGTVEPQFNAAWLRELDPGSNYVSGRLAGAEGPAFRLQLDRQNLDGYRLGIGVDVTADNAAFFSLRLNTERLGHYRDSTLMTQFGFEFL